MSIDLMNDPTVNKMWANRDTRLPFSAVWCGLLIKEGEIPAPVAVEYLRKEYNAAELESAADKLDAAAEKAPPPCRCLPAWGRVHPGAAFAGGDSMSNFIPTAIRLEQMDDAAHKILHDECPPTRAAYMCIYNESEEPCCESCWSSYLLDVYNGNAPGTTAGAIMGRM